MDLSDESWMMSFVCTPWGQVKGLASRIASRRREVVMVVEAVSRSGGENDCSRLQSNARPTLA